MRKWTRPAALAAVVLILLSPDLTEKGANSFVSLLAVGEPFAPYATAGAALFAGWIAIRSLRQRSQADDRQEWWKRTEFALTFALSRDDATANTGLRLLTALRDEDETATPADAAMLRDVVDALLTQLAQRGDEQPDDAPPTESNSSVADKIRRRLGPLRRCFGHVDSGP